MKEQGSGDPKEKRGYKVANWIEHKSFIVGTLALIAAVIAPAAIALLAERVALWEGVQIVGAEAYKEHVVYQAKKKQAA